MVIDLTCASLHLRIRTRSTPAVRHAIALSQAILALGWDGSVVVLRPRSVKELPPAEFESDLRPSEAVRELLRWTANLETEQALDELVRHVRRDAKLPPRQRRALIHAAASALAGDSDDGSEGQPPSTSPGKRADGQRGPAAR